MIKRVLITAGLASLLAACGGGGGNSATLSSNNSTTTSLSGAGMKGPFVIGSTVKICQLDTSTATCTNNTVSTTTTDKQGNFKATLPWTGWSMIEITGKSFNEDSNSTGTNDLTLKAITNITGSSDKPIVNLFTHWVAARITTLLSGSALATAYDTAHTNLQTEINLASKKTEDLNLLVGSGSNVSDNALLLLFSGAFHKIGGDANVLAQLTEDFADNGKFDKYRHMNKIRYAAGATNYLKQLHDNLVNNDSTVSPPNEGALASNNSIKKTTDPLAAQQWHLAKVKAAEAASCAKDANTCRGEGVLVGVLDDGVETAHEDLKDNIAYQKSRNYNETDTSKLGYYDPTPPDSTAKNKQAHGTAVAGLIAGVDNNGKGITGIAPRAGIAGFNILNAADSAAVDALGRTDIMVSNNSWGGTDGTCAYQAEDNTTATAIANAVSNGRDSKGTVFLFASGNGGDNCDENEEITSIEKDAMVRAGVTGDQSGQDGRNNNHQVLSIGALHNDDKKAEYAERGSTTLVAAPAGNNCDASNPALVTTDRSGENGYNKTGAANEISGQIDYTQCMNGTSGATPIVAGVVALMLQANPNLTWRDVRMILAETAQKNDDQDTDWFDNLKDVKVHPYYGFGMVDAKAAVEKAKSWTQYLPKQQSVTATLVNGFQKKGLVSAPAGTNADNNSIIDDPNNSSGRSHLVRFRPPSDIGFDTLETIEVNLTFLDHTRIGDAKVTMRTLSPSNSIISETLVNLNGDMRDSSTEDISVKLLSTLHLGSALPLLMEVRIDDDLANGKYGKVRVDSVVFRGYKASNTNVATVQ